MNPMLRTLSFFLAISALPCAGCLSGDADAIGTIEAPLLDPEGVGLVLQGPILQGPILQGINFNGIRLNGARFNGAMIQGYAVAQELTLRGGELVSFPATGGMTGGEDLEGATLSAVLSDNSTLPLQITDVTPTADAEIYEYTVAYWDGASWANLCGEQNGSPVRALALAGHWDESSGTPTGGDHIDDPSLFTFACKNAVLAKCVVAGYAPWRSLTECQDSDCRTIPMRDVHQACTRMMRADYCGDGTPHTQNGTLINEWDNFDVQIPDVVLPVTWTDEAEWSPNGALCIQSVRWSGTAESYIDQHCPNRWTSPAFDCFSEDSTFFSKPGFETPLAERSLLRNQFTHDSP